MKRPSKPSRVEEKPSPAVADGEAILQVKIWLTGISPMIWRRVLLPATFTVMLRQGAQFANQPALTGFLESKLGDDPVDIAVVGDDRLTVDLSSGLKKVGAFLGGFASQYRC